MTFPLSILTTHTDLLNLYIVHKFFFWGGGESGTLYRTLLGKLLSKSFNLNICWTCHVVQYDITHSRTHTHTHTHTHICTVYVSVNYKHVDVMLIKFHTMSQLVHVRRLYYTSITHLDKMPSCSSELVGLVWLYTRWTCCLSAEPDKVWWLVSV